MTTTVQIHPTAVIEKGAQIDSDVNIGAYAVIGKNVKLGKGTQVHHHALITGHTTVGEFNQIFSFASVGNLPQDLKYKGEPTTLTIGDRNIIREFATMQPGTIQDKGQTIIGNDNLFMAYTHIAHDCVIGNSNVMANTAQLAGHVTVHNMTVLGGLIGVHQFVHIGDMAIVGAGAMVTNDVPPYCIAEGNRATLRGLNVVAMKRRGMSVEARTALKDAYKTIFLRNHPTLDNALDELKKYLSFSEVENFIQFIKNSKRGVARPGADISVLE